MDRTKTQHLTLNTEKKYCKWTFRTQTQNVMTLSCPNYARDPQRGGAGRCKDILLHQGPRCLGPLDACPKLGHLRQTPGAPSASRSSLHQVTIKVSCKQLRSGAKLAHGAAATKPSRGTARGCSLRAQPRRRVQRSAAATPRTHAHPDGERQRGIAVLAAGTTGTDGDTRGA